MKGRMRNAAAVLVLLAACEGLQAGQTLPLGDPCLVSHDCGTGSFFCIKQDFPNGYCSRTCAADVDCPSGSACATSGPASGNCLKTCSSNADYRGIDTYVCGMTYARASSNVCAPGP